MARGYGGGRPLVRNSARATSQLADAGELRCRDPTASVVRPISTQSVRKRSVRPPAGHAGEVAQTRLANPFPPTPTTGRQRSAVWGTERSRVRISAPRSKSRRKWRFLLPRESALRKWPNLVRSQSGGSSSSGLRRAEQHDCSPLFLAARLCLGRYIEDDRRTLEGIAVELGFGESKTKEAVAWVGEKIGRLKLNGQLRGYSPLSRVLELEALAVGVSGSWRFGSHCLRCRGCASTSPASI